MILEKKLLLIGGIVGFSIPAIAAWTTRRSILYTRVKATGVFVLASFALVVIANVIVDTMNT